MQKNTSFSSSGLDHQHLTLFGDGDVDALAEKVRDVLNDKNFKILCPKNIETLQQAAQNSALVLILQDGLDPQNTFVAQKLRADRFIVCDIAAVFIQDNDYNPSKLLLNDYDVIIDLHELSDPDIKKILLKRSGLGSNRLTQTIHEEEYRRFSDALSSAPASVMVFDHDKRIVFVSEHYFRAYPKSAPRLCRGLSVFDAFDMMSREEKLDPKSDQYNEIKAFWHTLNGQIEFTLDTGVSYRLSAVPLSNQRGTIVTAVNITDYMTQKSKLEKALEELHRLKND